MMAKLIPVLPLETLKKLKPVCVEHRGVPYCVVRLKKKKVNAFVSICTHKDLAMFPPDVEKQRLTCPYHGVAFDAATGKVVKKRKKADALPKVAVELVDGIVHLESRKKHRKLVPKSERKWVETEGKKLQKKLERKRKKSKK